MHEKSVQARMTYTTNALRMVSKKLKLALFIAFLPPNFS